VLNTTDHVPRKASLRIHPAEAQAAQRFAGVAYNDLRPRVRAGETRLKERALQWAWQGVSLLDIESHCGTGRCFDVDTASLEDCDGYDTLELPVWHWKLVWVLLGYGLHLSKDIDLSLESLWETMAMHICESEDESEEDRRYTQERWEFYRDMRIDEGHVRCLWQRVRMLIQEVVSEVTDDFVFCLPWVLDPVPLDCEEASAP
jgi:hypothetical protein